MLFYGIRSSVLILSGVLLFGGVVSAAPATQILYGADGNASSTLYTIDPATGHTTAIAAITYVANSESTTGVGITGLAFHPTTGVLYGTTSGQTVSLSHSLVTINTTTGVATLVGSTGLTGPIPDITFTADGRLWGWSARDDVLVSINISTGHATLVGTGTNTCCGEGIATSPNGTVFFAGQGDNGPLATINLSTGAVTSGPTLTGAPNSGSAIAAMKFNAAGVLYAADNGGDSEGMSLVTINTTTGAIGNIGTLGHFIDAMAFTNAPATPPPPATVPALSTTMIGATVLLLGVAGLVLSRTRSAA